MQVVTQAVTRAALVIVFLTAAVPGWCASDELVNGQPLTLDECVVIALQNNPQITISEQGLITAQARVTRARSSYYPQLALSATEAVSDGRSDVAGDAGTERQEQVDLVLRQTLWERGRADSVAESQAASEATQWQHASTIQGLVDQVAADYYALLAVQQLVGVAESGVEAAQSHLEQVKARIEVGATAEVDVFPAEDDLARAELDQIDARSGVRLAAAALRNSMGVPQQTEFELAEALPLEGTKMPSLEEALAVAQERRPEVLSSLASLRGSGRALKLAKIRRGPLADVSGEYDWGYTDWEARDGAWDLRLSLGWPLFDGYSTEADVVAARAGLKRSEAELQRTLNQVGLDVQTALVSVERAWERVGASQKSVAAADARMRAAEGKYQQGVGIFIEVIDARTALTQAQASDVRAQYDYRTALVALERALGTLQVPAVEED
ncbi:MAG TPA: TolC family protein [Armatimonadota bacterium]|nr:TolC family protein [Armatimonadota bacterium]